MTNHELDKAVENKTDWAPISIFRDALKKLCYDHTALPPKETLRKCFEALFAAGYVLTCSDADARERAVEALKTVEIWKCDGPVERLSIQSREKCVSAIEAAGVALGAGHSGADLQSVAAGAKIQVIRAAREAFSTWCEQFRGRGGYATARACFATVLEAMEKDTSRNVDLYKALEPTIIQVHDPAPSWRPIESAPRDGTPILAWAPMATEPAIARWFKWDAGDEGWLTELVDGGPWKDDQHFAEYWAETSYEPTHWMPLPSPPEDDADGE